MGTLWDAITLTTPTRLHSRTARGSFLWRGSCKVESMTTASYFPQRNFAGKEFASLAPWILSSTWWLFILFSIYYDIHTLILELRQKATHYAYAEDDMIWWYIIVRFLLSHRTFSLAKMRQKRRIISTTSLSDAILRWYLQIFSIIRAEYLFYFRYYGRDTSPTADFVLIVFHREARTYYVGFPTCAYKNFAINIIASLFAMHLASLKAAVLTPIVSFILTRYGTYSLFRHIRAFMR